MLSFSIFTLSEFKIASSLEMVLSFRTIYSWCNRILIIFSNCCSDLIFFNRSWRLKKCSPKSKTDIDKAIATKTFLLSIFILSYFFKFPTFFFNPLMIMFILSCLDLFFGIQYHFSLLEI